MLHQKPAENLIIIAEYVAHYSYANIKACNLSSMDHNKFFAPLVKITQDECEVILGCDDMSALERITRCGKIVATYAAGNCLLKSYLAFNHLLQSFLLATLSNYDYCVPLSICTTRDHAFLLIDNKIVCDPLFGQVTTIKSPQYAHHKVYFGIRHNWSCFTENGEEQSSNQYAYILFTLVQHITDHSFFKKNYIELLDKIKGANPALNTSTQPPAVNSANQLNFYR